MPTYPIELDLRGRTVVVVGLGSVGRRKAAGLVEAEARVVGVDPEAIGELAGVEVVVGGATGADDFPLERTANQSFSTPCPLAWPFFLSLMNV